jgi:ElaA protein
MQEYSAASQIYIFPEISEKRRDIRGDSSYAAINHLPLGTRILKMNTTYTIKSFPELNVNELYALLRLRAEVFVVEQNCIFLDQDNKDQQCHHLLLYAEGKLAAYSRLVPAGLSYTEISIGRVITLPEFRGIGLGRKLMELAIQGCKDLFGSADIRIGAQTYALPFYSSLGFLPEGEVYDEDGIEHIEMIRSHSAT